MALLVQNDTENIRLDKRCTAARFMESDVLRKVVLRDEQNFCVILGDAVPPDTPKMNPEMSIYFFWSKVPHII